MKSLEASVQASMKSHQGGKRRKWFDTGFRILCQVTATLSVVILAVLLYSIFSSGLTHLSFRFLTSPPHPDPDKAGVWPALMGTVWTCAACAVLTLPVGVMTAIFLEEFKPKQRWAQRLHGLVQLNISNLAGVPSVVYGLVGLAAFVSMFGMLDRKSGDTTKARRVFEIGAHYYDQFLTINDQVIFVPLASGAAPETKIVKGIQALDSNGNTITVRLLERGSPPPESEADQSITVKWNETPGRISRNAWYYFRLPFGRSVLTGSLTLMLVILPVVIISSQEAIRAVPSSLREAAFGMGATAWQSVWNVTLPASIPGIMTGSILAMSRAVGEAAPIMMISGIVYITSSPSSLMSDFTVLSLQIFDWSSRHDARFHAISASAIIVLLILLLCFNFLAIIIRQVFSKPLS
jgi:phosphate transport system permease protein